MSCFRFSSAALFLVTVGGLASPALAAPSICDGTQGVVTPKQCDAVANTYKPGHQGEVTMEKACPIVSPPPPETPSYGGDTYHCADADVSPAPALMACEDMGNGFMCEAFPQGDGLSYSWSTTGRATQPYPNDPVSPAKILGCSGGGSGTVTVTVTSPYGLSDTFSRNLYCGF